MAAINDHIARGGANPWPDLRYDDWEYSRRPAAEKLGGGALGYVHLRAMGSGDIAQW